MDENVMFAAHACAEDGAGSIKMIINPVRQNRLSIPPSP